jgi:hypothetical protein
MAGMMPHYQFCNVESEIDTPVCKKEKSADVDFSQKDKK